MGEARRRDQGVYALPAWTEFKRAYAPPVSIARIREHARATGASEEDVQRVYEDIEKNEPIFRNSRYQVNVRDNGDMIHLSIKRLDKRPPCIERFRDFQRIKNELVGPECVALEVYPAESEMVDTSNQYHLWVFKDPTYRLPFGLGNRRVVLTESHAGARQLPFEED